MSRKVLLLRVGIDKGCGGTLGPIFSDGQFEYISIPESKASRYPETYATLVGRSGESLSAWVPTKLGDIAPHLDPEFGGFTYGDPTRTKAAQLKKLSPGDLLVFYAGLQSDPAVEGDRSRLYIIGHFEIDQIFDLGHARKSEYRQLRESVGPNAHLFRREADQGLVIARGRRGHSELYEQAIPLADGNNELLNGVGEAVNYQGSMLRAVGRWIEGEDHAAALKRYIQEGPSSLVREGDRLFSYVLATDGGFAPNPYAGYCTLACCKPQIRGEAKPGDWVVGMCPKKIGSRKVAYAMRVDEVLSFSEYFHDKRFQLKKPSSHPDGDNIYRRMKNGEFFQLKNPHHGVESIARDTSTDIVLIGGLYWYFGGEPQSTPDDLSDHLAHPYVGRKVTKDADIIRRVADWLHGNYRTGMHAGPRNQVAENSVGLTCGKVRRKPTC